MTNLLFKKIKNVLFLVGLVEEVLLLRFILRNQEHLCHQLFKK